MMHFILYLATLIVFVVGAKVTATRRQRRLQEARRARLLITSLRCLYTCE